MSYKSILVHLQLGQPHDCLLQLAASLAERFSARLLGTAASQPMQMAFGGDDPSVAFVNEDRDEIGREMREAKAEFRSGLIAQRDNVDWESATLCSSIADYVSQLASSADLVLTGSVASSIFDTQRHIDISQLIKSVGRPVLIVPPEAASLQLDKLMVAWDGSREARRAISDALPLLKEASQVSLVHIANGDDAAAAQLSLDRVRQWLALHGVVGAAFVSPPGHGDARQLNEVAIAHGCDLLIAGAYGHSQMREWLVGGVTHSLLQPQRYSTFLSH
jgi:nucleotide-binding universal stress UspA family protein